MAEAICDFAPTSYGQSGTYRAGGIPTSVLPTTRELTIGLVNEATLLVTNADASQSIGIRTWQAYRWRSRYTVEVLAPREGASCYSLIQIAKPVV